jgi:hypothetical protein
LPLLVFCTLWQQHSSSSSSSVDVYAHSLKMSDAHGAETKRLLRLMPVLTATLAY